MQGWIKLHRKLIANPFFSDPFFLKLWVYCLLKASHSDTKHLVGNNLVELKEGQFVTGRYALAKDFNEGLKPSKRVSESTLWRMLSTLEDAGMLKISKTTKFSIVTIVNWQEYQEREQLDNKDRKKVTKPSSGKEKYPEGNQYLNMAKYFYERVAAVAKAEGLSHLIIKADMQKWADDFRKLVEINNVDKRLAKEVMDWVTQDSFWRTNVLSPNKLREKFGDLALKMKSSQKPKAPPTQQKVSDPRDKEIEFQQYLADGGDPNEFDWRK
jgi:ribosomal protein S19E (S16A)